jgi:hypothetical protein
MIYGTRVLKNGRITASLEFESGKRVFLNYDEAEEFNRKVREWLWAGRERERQDKWLERSKST